MLELRAAIEIFLAVGFNNFTKAVKKSNGREVGDSPVKTWNYQA
jgi:hypothetical protein